jgi:hypothetical protein
MKLPIETRYLPIGIFNAFTLTGISLLWGHLLDLISLWFLPLTIVSILIGYGSEIKVKNDTK